MVSEPGFDQRGPPVLHVLALQSSAVVVLYFCPLLNGLFTLTCVLNFSLIFRLFASTQAFLDNVFTEHTRGWEGEYF